MYSYAINAGQVENSKEVRPEYEALTVILLPVLVPYIVSYLSMMFQAHF